MINKKSQLFYLIKKLKTHYYRYKKKQIIAQIRDHMSFFGLDISKMTDEEIEQGSIRIGQIASLSAISAADAAKAFNKLSSALKEIQS